MNKFSKHLSKDADGIRLQRSEMIAEETKTQQQMLITILHKEKRDLDMEILNLSDIGPETSDSLRPAGQGFDSKQWVKKMQELKMKRLEKLVEIELAEETFNEWFKEEPEEKKSKK